MAKYILLLSLILHTTTYAEANDVTFDNQEYLDNRLNFDLDGENFTLLVKSLSFKELKMWGDYKIFKVNLTIKESYEKNLKGNICVIIQMEPPYSQMPIYPKEFLISFSEKEKSIECYHNDMINIYPESKRYFEKIKLFKAKYSN